MHVSAATRRSPAAQRPPMAAVSQARRSYGPPAVVQISSKAKDLSKARRLLEVPKLKSTKQIPSGKEFAGSQIAAAAESGKKSNSLMARLQRGDNALQGFNDRPLMSRAKSLSGMKVQEVAAQVKASDGLGARIARNDRIFDARELGRLQPELYRKLGQTFLERARS